jgi:hypothetical protein
MKIKELKKLVQEGKRPVIKIKEEAQDYLMENFDNEMIGKVIGIDTEFEFDDKTYGFIVDMNNYEKHNRSVAQRVWSDGRGGHSHTWFESGHYPKDGIETIYFPFELELPFEILEENGLMNEYINENLEITYLEWLENKVLESRK